MSEKINPKEWQKLQKALRELKKNTPAHATSIDPLIHELEARIAEIENAAQHKGALEIVKIARHPRRPTTAEYIGVMINDFIELHGDRRFGDDQAIVGGIGFLNDIPVTIIGQQKGKNVKDNLKRHFGMAHPEGYRKALRLMEQAERFGRPVITLIDTPGAYPGIGAEERGQAEAIAYNLYRMSALRVPIVTVVIGEGGSGGALGIGIADQLFMLANAIYSVISPEGCASILWKDSSRAAEAAEALKITARDIFRLGISDGIIDEPDPGAHETFDETAKNIKRTVTRSLAKLLRLKPAELLEQRYQKYRRMGEYIGD